LTTTASHSFVWGRHGIARHNVRDSRTGQGPNLEDPAWLDPPLIRQGRVEALAVGDTIRGWWRHNKTTPSDRIELIVTSPLTRCLQTAALAFLPGLSDDGDDAYEDDIDPAPTVCVEDVREAFGVHYPDRRRRKSVLERHWRGVQFDAEMTELDELWRPDRRETWDDIRARVRKFLDVLSVRPEGNVVVVSHGVWIECCLHVGCPGFLAGGRRVYNCDAYACRVVSRSGKFLRLEDVRQVYCHQHANSSSSSNSHVASAATTGTSTHQQGH